MAEVAESRPPLRWSIPILLATTYAPYTWILTMDYPWDDYRWMWVRLWPVLPGFVPCVAANSVAPWSSDWPLFGGMAVLTALILWVVLRFGTRSRRSLVVVTAIVAVLSVLNSWATNRAFGL